MHVSLFNLEFANNISVVFGSQIVVSAVINVFAEEMDGSIAEQELSTTGVTGFESKFVGPVVPPIAARCVG